jgi:hypothetical protein
VRAVSPSERSCAAAASAGIAVAPFARHGERAGRLGDTSAASRLPRTFLAIAETDLLDTRRISRTSACGLTAP